MIPSSRRVVAKTEDRKFEKRGGFILRASSLGTCISSPFSSNTVATCTYFYVRA